MKYIAVFLILNVLLLSSVTGMANIHHGTASCCKENAHASDCKQQKHHPDDDCAKGNCNALLSCGTCGFIVIPSVSVLPAMIDLNNQTVHPLAIGELSDYHGNGWNPPKA
jgi:hypothetical protein